MSTEPFIGEIDIMAFNFPPRGWALCNGQLLNIQQNMALFSLLGIYFGGDGRTTFALPDMRGRVPVHQGQSFTLGAGFGSTTVTLTRDQLPAHSHAALASSQGASSAFAPANSLAQTNNLYRNPESLTIVNPETISTAGGGQAHENMAPYAVLSFCIALYGIYPSRN